MKTLRGIHLEKPISVTILGHAYQIRSDADAEEVQEIARYVNDKFTAIMDHAGGLSERKLAILVAFDIASDYFQVLKDKGGAVRDFETRIRSLNRRIDSAMT